MWSALRLLFSANYWRVLTRPDTWLSGGVSLRRLHKDRRARKELRKLLLLLLAPFLCLAYVLGYAVWVVGNGGALIGASVGVVMLAVIIVYRRRKPVEQDGPLTLSLQARPTGGQRADAAPVVAVPELRRELGELALLHAVLADRAGSERFLKTKVLPEGMQIVTRQRHLQILREQGLYERLGDIERNLLLAPDGHWDDETIGRVVMLLEPLRLLRWVLRVDAFLGTVGSHLAWDFRLAGSLVREPELAMKAGELIEISDIRTAMGAAEQCFYRCLAEGVSRGFYTVQEGKPTEEALAYAGRLKGREEEDLLLGTTIVSLASDLDVQLGATLGLRRTQVLGWVRARMYGEVGPKALLEGFYLRESS